MSTLHALSYLCFVCAMVFPLAGAAYCNASSTRGSHCAGKIHYICINGRDTVSEDCICGCAEGRGCKEFPPCTTIPQPPTLGHEGTPIVVVVTGRSTLLILVLGVLAGVALATMFLTLCARKEVRVLLEDQKLISTLIGRVFSKS